MASKKGKQSLRVASGVFQKTGNSLKNTLVDRIFHVKTGTGRLQKNNDKRKDDSINQKKIC